ncbi:hypothetical protein HMPREF0083_05598 [Aneurinibacillus aneurinilyticus ATCC 12856]|uniref:Uncharacterized protein n=1 Tax=Aneurinibacillus aneurinilyticus ATCC 12856 TaxID=649747 RepID=U1WTN0_ANEAE|nr:hypothetical protein HMPREF0083_05598 [Aneurinibacillus aneurinilyticus ATCC 12856]
MLCQLGNNEANDELIRKSAGFSILLVEVYTIIAKIEVQGSAI